MQCVSVTAAGPPSSREAAQEVTGKATGKAAAYTAQVTWSVLLTATGTPAVLLGVTSPVLRKLIQRAILCVNLKAKGRPDGR